MNATEPRSVMAPPPEPLLPETLAPEALAEALLDSLAQVLGVLEAELPLLRAMRTKEIGGLAADKSAATASYQSLLQKLRGEPKLIESFTSAQRVNLRRAALRLAEATAENARALHSGLEANHRLVQVIASAVEKQQLGDTGYRPRGRGHGSAFKLSPPAVSVNRVL